MEGQVFVFFPVTAFVFDALHRCHTQSALSQPTERRVGRIHGMALPATFVTAVTRLQETSHKQGGLWVSEDVCLVTQQQSGLLMPTPPPTFTTTTTTTFPSPSVSLHAHCYYCMTLKDGRSCTTVIELKRGKPIFHQESYYLLC